MDVLAVLKSDTAAIELYIEKGCTSLVQVTQWSDHLAQHKKACSAVAELIEADLEFDAAHLTYSNAKTGKPRNDAWAWVQAAVDRRHAALKRVVGGDA